MSRTESAQESSMEEILASIRRIISEDAAPPKPQPVPAARAFNRAIVQPASSGPVATSIAPAAPPPDPLLVEDDEILDLGANYAAVTRSPLPASDPLDRRPPTPGQNGAAMAFAPELEPTPQAWAASPPFVEPDPVPATNGVQSVDSEAGAIGLPEPIEETGVSPFDPLEPVALPDPMPVAPMPVAPMSAAPVEGIEPFLEMSPPLPVLDPAATEARPDEAPAALAAATSPLPVTPDPVAPSQLATANGAPAANGLLNTTVPIGVTARTLEDTVAEMLKPMLRDWLDANMPRIIEKVMAKDGV